MTDRTLLQQALEALELHNQYPGSIWPFQIKAQRNQVIAAIRARLAEPDPDYPCRSDGRCQYAIDSGAEGMGHCPKGKCVMPDDTDARVQQIMEAAEQYRMFASVRGSSHIQAKTARAELERVVRECVRAARIEVTP